MKNVYHTSLKLSVLYIIGIFQDGHLDIAQLACDMSRGGSHSKRPPTSVRSKSSSGKLTFRTSVSADNSKLFAKKNRNLKKTKTTPKWSAAGWSGAIVDVLWTCFDKFTSISSDGWCFELIYIYIYICIWEYGTLFDTTNQKLSLCWFITISMLLTKVASGVVYRFCNVFYSFALKETSWTSTLSSTSLKLPRRHVLDDITLSCP